METENYHVRLELDVNTGNIPYKLTLFEMYVSDQIKEYIEFTGCWGIMSAISSGYIPVGEYLDILFKGLLHLCSNPELYIPGPIDQTENAKLVNRYQQTIYLFSSFITACVKYPKATIITERKRKNDG